MEMTDHCEHVWVRMTGYGLAVVPTRGFVAVAEHGAVPWVDIELRSGEFARVLPHEGGFKSQLDPATTKSVYDVAGIVAIDSPARWTVQTSRYRCDWPPGLRLRSTAFPADSCAFEFFTDDELMIWVQTPQRIPALHDMGGTGQSLVGMDAQSTMPSVWFSYSMQCRPWLQRHSIINLGGSRCVLSLQCPADMKGKALEHVVFLEASFGAG